MCVCGVWYVSANDVSGQIPLQLAAHTGRYYLDSYVLYRCCVCVVYDMRERATCMGRFTCIWLHTRAGTVYIHVFSTGVCVCVVYDMWVQTTCMGRFTCILLHTRAGTIYIHMYYIGVCVCVVYDMRERATCMGRFSCIWLHTRAGTISCIIQVYVCVWCMICESKRRVWADSLAFCCTHGQVLFTFICICSCVCAVWYVSANDVYGQILLHLAAHMGRYCLHSYVLYRYCICVVYDMWVQTTCLGRFSCILLHTRAGTIYIHKYYIGVCVCVVYDMWGRATCMGKFFSILLRTHADIICIHMYYIGVCVCVVYRMWGLRRVWADSVAFCCVQNVCVCVFVCVYVDVFIL